MRLIYSNAGTKSGDKINSCDGHCFPLELISINMNDCTYIHMCVCMYVRNESIEAGLFSHRYEFGDYFFVVKKKTNKQNLLLVVGELFTNIWGTRVPAVISSFVKCFCFHWLINNFRSEILRSAHFFAKNLFSWKHMLWFVHNKVN